MADPLADDFAAIARNLRHMQDLKREAQDKANAEEALEQQMQRADEPMSMMTEGRPNCSACGRPMLLNLHGKYYCGSAHNPLGFVDRPDFDEEWVSIVGQL
jgi:hypothetical protein